MLFHAGYSKRSGFLFFIIEMKVSHINETVNKIDTNNNLA